MNSHSPSLLESSTPLLCSQHLSLEPRHSPSLQSYRPLSLKLSLALPSFLHLPFSPSVSLHISLGLVPLIKHSCRTHRKAPLFSHCYINWLAVFLRPWPCWLWVTSVTVVYALDRELNLLAPLTRVIQPIHKYVFVCVCASVCMFIWVCTSDTWSLNLNQSHSASPNITIPSIS